MIPAYFLPLGRGDGLDLPGSLSALVSMYLPERAQPDLRQDFKNRGECHSAWILAFHLLIQWRQGSRRESSIWFRMPLVSLLDPQGIQAPHSWEASQQRNSCGESLPKILYQWCMCEGISWYWFLEDLHNTDHFVPDFSNTQNIYQEKSVYN